MVPWTKARRAAQAQQDFHIYWKVRLLLNVLGAAWLVRPWQQHSILYRTQLQRILRSSCGHAGGPRSHWLLPSEELAGGSGLPGVQLSQWLRLAGFWAPGSPVFPGHVTQWTGRGALCRIYLCASLGVLEPLFLTTVVLLCRGPLRYLLLRCPCGRGAFEAFIGNARSSLAWRVCRLPGWRAIQLHLLQGHSAIPSLCPSSTLEPQPHACHPGTRSGSTT